MTTSECKLENRYSQIDGKTGFKREMVLLKSLPCKWGKCRFCDYIRDNSKDETEIDIINKETLLQVQGGGGLDVINSASIFDLSSQSMAMLRKSIQEKNISELFVESHWLYRNEFDVFRQSFSIPVRIRVGIETFDDAFRNTILRKGVFFSSIEEVVGYCDAVCLMVGIVGQTKDMIARDIEILTSFFTYGTVNIFTENSLSLKADQALIDWFYITYGSLDEFPCIDVLYNNLDYGVNA